MSRTRAQPQLSRHKEANGGRVPIMNRNQYTIREVPLHAPRPIRVVGIGAGASGINMVRTLRQTLADLPFEHVVYEKNEGVGGTWFENRYPGCRCDVPSPSYQFSWWVNPEWSNLFAPAAEIEQYLRKICEEETMMDCIKTSHKVTGAVWSEERSIWEIEVKNLKTGQVISEAADFLIDASGILK